MSNSSNFNPRLEELKKELRNLMKVHENDASEVMDKMSQKLAEYKQIQNKCTKYAVMCENSGYKISNKVKLDFFEREKPKFAKEIARLGKVLSLWYEYDEISNSEIKFYYPSSQFTSPHIENDVVDIEN
jgi:hypothetical protein